MPRQRGAFFFLQLLFTYVGEHMPSHRSILADINKFNLDPSKAYRVTHADGRLAKSATESSVKTELAKPVFEPVAAPVFEPVVTTETSPVEEASPVAAAVEDQVVEVVQQAEVEMPAEEFKLEELHADVQPADVQASEPVEVKDPEPKKETATVETSKKKFGKKSLNGLCYESSRRCFFRSDRFSSLLGCRSFRSLAMYAVHY